ncbi:MAG TPA: hypothetical protein VF584_25615 [Longimicrobium sp.]
MMPKLLDRAVRLTLALVVAGGLGIGARSAVAASAASSSCPTDPDSGYLGLSCSRGSQCDDACRAYYGEWSGAGCNQGCCICAI